MPSAGRLAVSGALYAALVLSHNLTSLFLSPVLAVYCAVLLIHRRTWRAALFLGAAMVLGLALSAFPPDLNIKATLLAQRGDYEAHRVSTPKDVTVLYEVLYYPAWHAYADGRELVVGPYSPDGLGWVTFTIPAGEHLVELRFEATPLVQVASGLSLVALLVLAELVGLAIWRRRPPQVSHPSTEQAATTAWTLALTIVGLLVFRYLVLDPNANWFRYSSPPGTTPPALVCFCWDATYWAGTGAYWQRWPTSMRPPFACTPSSEPT